MPNRAIFLAAATAMFFATGVCNAADLPKCNDRRAFQVISDLAKQASKNTFSGLLVPGIRAG
jgi:hypothetical protein